MSKLLAYVTAHPWALMPEVYDQLATIVHRHARGDRLPEDEVAAIVARGEVNRDTRERRYEVRDGVAVVPIHGVIARNAGEVSNISSRAGTSVDHIRADLRRALVDPDAHSVLLDIDSPGGSVDGLSELADEIYAARQRKPIYTLADGTMASAAYWLGAQAERVFSTPSSLVGSIGVIAEAIDDTGWQQTRGIRRHVIATSKAKAAAAPPIDDEDLATLRGTVDAFMGLFRAAVGRGRGLEGEALDGVANGRVWVGADAKRVRLVDELATFEGALAAIGRRRRRARPAAAATGGGVQSEALVDVAAALSAEEITAALAAAGHPPFRAENTEPAPEAEHDTDTEDPREGPMAKQETGAPQDTGATLSAETTAEQITQHAPRAAAELLAQGAKSERERIQAIQAAAVDGQAEMVGKLIAEGATELEAVKALHTDLRQRHTAKLEGVRETRKPAQPEATYTEPAGKGKAERKGSIEEQAREDFATLPPAQQRAFGPGGFRTFLALYKRDPDHAMGRVDYVNSATPSRAAAQRQKREV